MAGLTVNWSTHTYPLPALPASSSFEILIPLNQTRIGDPLGPTGHQGEIPAGSYCDFV